MKFNMFEFPFTDQLRKAQEIYDPFDLPAFSKDFRLEIQDKIRPIPLNYEIADNFEVRTLVLTSDGVRVGLKYGKCVDDVQGYKKPVPKDETELITHLARFQDSSFPHQVDVAPPGTPTTEETPLSINAKLKSLIVLTLPAGGNLEFNSKGAPFSARGASDHMFKDCGKIMPDGRIVRNKSPFPLLISDGDSEVIDQAELKEEPDCRAAFFVVDAVQYGNFFKFNIHLDITGLFGTDNFRIPIIIDPDVRHPGGTRPG
ncbi:MAG: hypothetical protein AAFR64_09415 [Pseudomonadota bacterium]